MFLEEERPQNGGGDYQKDTGSEPRTGSFTRVGVARTELLIDPHSADQADDGAHNDDARRCRKKIFPHLLLLPKRFGGYTMRTMAPS